MEVSKLYSEIYQALMYALKRKPRYTVTLEEALGNSLYPPQTDLSVNHLNSDRRYIIEVKFVNLKSQRDRLKGQIRKYLQFEEVKHAFAVLLPSRSDDISQYIKKKIKELERDLEPFK